MSVENVKNILNEHSFLDAGGGNHIIGSPNEPTKNNFEGKIWFNTDTKKHYIFYDGKYHPVSGGEISGTYHGLEKKMKEETGEFKIVIKFDKNGGILHRSTLINPNENGQFTRRRLELNVGRPSSKTQLFDLTYDEDGDLIKESLVEGW